MRRIKIGLVLSVATILVISGISIAAGPPSVIPAAEEAKDEAAAPDNSPKINEDWELEIYPYLIKSDDAELKLMLGVRNEFPNGFTAWLIPEQVTFLNELGIETEPVQLYQTLGRPDCPECPEGILVKPPCDYDGICDPEENPSCPDCKNGEDEEPPPPCFPDNQYTWGIIKVNGGSGGTGVIVAVLDTGVYVDHLDLDVALCKDATKGPAIRNGCKDDVGHGTHVSGTVAAIGGDGLGIYGVAPEATLWMIKVCGKSGCWTDDIAAAIDYAGSKGANIISMSFGGRTQSSLIKDAIDRNPGVLYIAAAGNYDPVYNPDNVIQYPAANPKVVAVGAIDEIEAVPSWSSIGINPGEVEYFIEEKEVEVGAPGVSIESTSNDGCYTYMSGTSMAAPHVAGLAAKLWQGSAEDTRSYLQELAKNQDLHTIGDDGATGFGLPVAP